MLTWTVQAVEGSFAEGFDHRHLSRLKLEFAAFAVLDETVAIQDIADIPVAAVAAVAAAAVDIALVAAAAAAATTAVVPESLGQLQTVQLLAV